MSKQRRFAAAGSGLLDGELLEHGAVLCAGTMPGALEVAVSELRGHREVGLELFERPVREFPGGVLRVRAVLPVEREPLSAGRRYGLQEQDVFPGQLPVERRVLSVRDVSAGGQTAVQPVEWHVQVRNNLQSKPLFVELGWSLLSGNRRNQEVLELGQFQATVPAIAGDVEGRKNL